MSWVKANFIILCYIAVVLTVFAVWAVGFGGLQR